MSSKANTKKFLIILLVVIINMCSNVKADFTFGEPVNIGPIVNSSDWEGGPSISADGLTLFFDSLRSGGFGEQNLWVTIRNTKDDEWGEPVNIGSIVNTIASDNIEWQPSISADGLSLYFVADWDLWVATRQTKEDAWNLTENL